jgi:hypothetical protein
MSWNLGDKTNPKSMKGYSEFGVLGDMGLHGRKAGKLLRKTCGSPTSEGGKAERQQTGPIGLWGRLRRPASFAHGITQNLHPPLLHRVVAHLKALGKLS